MGAMPVTFLPIWYIPSVMSTIKIASDLRDRLRARKVGNETYGDVITRLLDETAESRGGRGR